MKTDMPRPKHMRLGLYIILLLIAAGSMAAIKACSHGRHGQQFKADGDTITVGIQYAPLSFYMYDDTLGGFDYDLLRLIAQRHKAVFKFKPITTEREGLEGLTEGRYDVVAADFPLTAEMKEEFLFTEPAYLDRQVLVQRADTTGPESRTVASVLDLRDDTVYIPAGSPIRSRLHHISDELGDTIHIKELPYTPEQLFINVALGKIPCAVINEQTAKVLARDYPAVDISTSISFSQFQPWIVAKSDKALCDSLDSWLTDVKRTAAYQEILDRYVR